MTEKVDIVIVGAGFAGLRALYTFRKLGYSAIVLERDEAIGGVWNFNRYAGARCDVESYDYSYRFSHELEQEWRWSERYATQPEILRYINHVADRFDLRRDIELNTLVNEARYDAEAGPWRRLTGMAGYLICDCGAGPALDAQGYHLSRPGSVRG